MATTTLLNSRLLSFYGPLYLLLLALAPLAAADEAAPPDPLNLVLPAGAPEFHEVLHGAEWNERFAKAQKDLGDLDTLAKSEAGEAGYLVTEITPGGQADELKLDHARIVQIDDKPIIYGQDIQTLRTDADQSMTVIGKSRKAKHVKIHAGPIGLNVASMLWPEMAYLRHAPRNAAWDNYAAVGAARCMADPELAETAWHHAMAAGYTPDELSDFCGMQCAWRQGRNDDAVRWCAAMDARPDKLPALSREIWSEQIALANFKIEQALAMRMAVDPGPAKLDGPEANQLNVLLRAWRDRPEAQRRLPAPSELADRHSTSLLADMEPHGPAEEAEWRRKVADDFAEHKSYYRVVVPTDHFQRFAEAPRDDAADVEAVFHVVCTQTDKQKAQYARVFSAGLVNCDREEYLDNALVPSLGGMIKLELEHAEQGRIWQDSDQMTNLGSFSVVEETDNGREFTLRVLHSAGREELWINRRRLIYLPSTERAKKVGFFFTMVGTTVAVKMEFSRIDRDAAKDH